MQYTIKPVDDKEPFRPFEVTLRIESLEEYIIFHDKVATRIAQSSKFIGDVYRAGREGCRRTVSGEVPLKNEDILVGAELSEDSSGEYITYRGLIWRAVEPQVY